MALSTFLRTPAYTNPFFSQHIMRLSTIPSLSPRVLGSIVPLKKQQVTENKTPIFNAVRSISTSNVLRAGKGGDHTKLWVVEKLVSAALVPVIPLALLMPCKPFDSALAFLITMHVFWGAEAIAQDYIRESLFGPFWPKVAVAVVYAITIMTFAGLFYIINHDIGIANTIKKIWSIKSNSQNA